MVGRFAVSPEMFNLGPPDTHAELSQWDRPQETIAAV